MPELKTKCTTFLITYICDNCGAGELNFTKKVSDAHFLHKCDHCEVEYALVAPYPIMEPIPRDDTDDPVMAYKVRWDKMKSVSDIKELLDPILEHANFDYSRISPVAAEKVRVLEKKGFLE